MNQLQEVEFEILRTVTEICDRLGIIYYLVCGSALGAVKYGGFIPWDDDVDIGIFRADYERFLREAPAYFPPHLFLQHFRSDPNYPHIFAKVRNSTTTYIEKSASRIPMNHGVYIDIFPLDGYPSTKAARRKLEFRKKWYKRLISCAFECERSPAGQMAAGILCMLGVHKHTASILRRYERTIMRYSVADAEIICNHGNWQGVLEYAPREQYGSGYWVEFEGLPVRIPQQYDAYLTQKYGDWRSDLPADQQVGHHFYEVCDLTRSYKDYPICIKSR